MHREVHHRAPLPALATLPVSGSDTVYMLLTTTTARKDSTVSEEMQRSHFNAFFAPKHHIRRPLLPDASLPAMLRILVDGLRKIGSSAAWFRLQLHIRVNHTFRKRARCLLQTRAKRDGMLDGWLAYWRAAEARIQQGFRQQLQNSVTLHEVLRGGRGTIARAITPVADSLKVQAIWELYWILRAQYTYRLKTHLRRLLALISQRKAILQRRSSGLEVSAAVDFWQGDAVSLRAVDASIFLRLLQEPKFEYVAGRDIKATELLRLANANLAEGSWVEVLDSPMGVQGCPTLLAFLSSPLLTEPHWLRGRSRQTSTVIPPRTWNPSRPSPDGPPSLPPSPSSNRQRLSGQDYDVQSQPYCSDNDPEPPIICCELVDLPCLSPSTTPSTPLSPIMRGSMQREKRPALSYLVPGISIITMGDADTGRRTHSLSVSPPPSPSCLPLALRRGSGALHSKPTPRPVSPRVLSPRAVSPRAPPRPSYDHLFKQHRPEVTTIYPKLPMAHVVPAREPLCLRRRSQRSPPQSPSAASALSPVPLPSSGPACSLPTILHRHI